MNLPQKSEYLFRLYIAGEASNSRLARANLDSICRQYLAGLYQVEIVDILDDPLRAIQDKILVTPTLIRLFPQPHIRLVGNLCERSKVVQVLGLGLKNEE
jgi:circadian clock protein KaiB